MADLHGTAYKLLPTSTPVLAELSLYETSYGYELTVPNLIFGDGSKLSFP